ncbi:phosphatase [Clostridium paraputrificum]|uniref:phosphatase n=1 Tax=Clostridium paraputrificum TaxID=29363 RepID=UPI003D3353CD
MNYSSDLHTHTIVSGHAYTTLLENVAFCAENGIKVLGTSDHGPTMPNAPHPWYFGNLKVVPRTINGVIILKGIEANIKDISGSIDLEPSESKALDYMIASFHEPIFKPMSLAENTTAMINAIENNDKVEVVGHLGNPNYELDYEAIVKKAKEKNVMVEINNCSIIGSSRNGSKDNCKRIAELCKEHSTKIILSSDSHISFTIGKFDQSIEMLKSIDFPEELIMNDPDKLIPHLKSKGRLSDL